MQLMPQDLVGFTQRVEYFVRSDGWILCVLYLPEQHHEFIAPETADGIRTAHAAQQPAPDGLQQSITDRVPQRVIDMFEAVKIQEQHRQLPPVAMGKGDCFVQSVMQQCPIR